MTKSWWYIILFCFSFLLIPKDYWHQCEDHNHSNYSTEFRFEKADVDCDICDFKLFQLHQIELKSSSKISYYNIPNLGINEAVVAIINHIHLNRGPPSNS